jgi:alkanesulfonate monooxygenase SsuD/methylene tetrahydromethanopterin reductase-like flavin-dependent oxidoreductase (luciferase family)
MEFGHEGQSLARLHATVDAARDCGFVAVSANDHFVFSTPWLDGPTALAAAVARSAGLELATTVSLVALRGPVPLAKTLVALDLLSGGRLVAGLGPGSSKRDYDAIGIPFEDRWKRFEEAVAILRALLGRAPAPEPARYYSLPDAELLPSPSGAVGSRSGSAAGARQPGSAGSRAWPTGGWRRPTTRPPSASRPDASNWPASSPGTAAERPGSLMRS